MQVLGVDRTADAYRVAIQDEDRHWVGLVPEALIDGGWGRPTHQRAYEWIAGRAPALRRAILDLAAGRTPPAPYDTITLTAEHRCPPRS